MRHKEIKDKTFEYYTKYSNAKIKVNESQK